MRQNEDSHEPKHFTSTKVIEAPVESTPSGGDQRTSTSTTTCETSEQTSTTEPPYHHSEVDATIDCNESMRMESLKKLYSTYTRIILMSIFFTLIFIIASFKYVFPIDIGLPLIVGLSLLNLSLILELKEKKYFDRSS